MSKSISVLLPEFKEAAVRFPNMPVHKALELNRYIAENVARVLRGIREGR